MTAKAELLFAELFHSLLSLDNELNIAQSVIIYFKFFTVIELSIVCAAMGLYCIPECGVNRWGIPVLALSGFLTQMLIIFGMKVEEDHIVGITDNASSI